MNCLAPPDVSYASLMSLPNVGLAVDDEIVAKQVEVQAKYHGYIERQREEIDRDQQL